MAIRKGSDNRFPLVRILRDAGPPGTPPAGEIHLRSDDDGVFYTIDEDDNIVEMGDGGAGAGLAAHLGDPADAHDASATSVADAGGHFAATDVEAALAELATRKATIGWVIDATTGAKAPHRIPFACTITRATIMTDGAGTTGTISVDFWKDTWANYPPVVGDKISASAPIALSGANHAEDATLTGWTTAVAAGDVIVPNVSSVSGAATYYVVQLEVTRT